MKPAIDNRGFFFLNVTQFCGAANDNILKQLLIFGLAAGGIWADKLGAGAQAYASLCLAIPFVLFSGFAGQFADRYSKRDVSIVVKLSEIFIAALAMYGLWVTNVWIVLLALILISLQSTFFTPAKYGILPEILPATRLSRANGTINMFTYLAVILGGAVGGPLYDVYAPDTSQLPDAIPMLWLPGVILLVLGVFGTAASFGLPRLTAKNPTMIIRPMLFRTYVETWREIAGTPVASAVIAWAYFYFIVGGLAILILPDYKDLLDITATQTAGLMAVLGIAIGIGDYVAGRVSGHRIRPELIPIGAIGTTVTFLVLGLLVPKDYYVVSGILAVCGFVAGFFMVPLQTMVQHLTPEAQRGRVLGLWNCGSFGGIIIGNLLFLAIKQTGVPSDRVFLLCGLLGLISIAMYYLRWGPMFAEAVRNAPTSDGAETADHRSDRPSSDGQERAGSEGGEEVAEGGGVDKDPPETGAEDASNGAGP
jgi:acyl-[acyl-carrier-protein]-phospholipid O-acyltransferase/long-chain-fatty-acid--[acyl-carrier-protein] ligase